MWMLTMFGKKKKTQNPTPKTVNGTVTSEHAFCDLHTSWMHSISIVSSDYPFLQTLSDKIFSISITKYEVHLNRMKIFCLSKLYLEFCKIKEAVIISILRKKKKHKTTTNQTRKITNEQQQKNKRTNKQKANPNLARFANISWMVRCKCAVYVSYKESLYFSSSKGMNWELWDII